MFRYVPLLFVCAATAAFAQSSVQQPMPFDQCVQQLQTPVSGAIGPGIMIVDTDETKQIQYLVSDGLVTITCSKSDQQVTISHL